MDLILLFQENQELVFTYGVPMLLSLIVLFLIIRLYLVERRLNRLLKGSKRDNLEVILQKTVESNHEIEKDLNELYDLCGKLQRAAVDSLQNIGLCKFNALPVDPTLHLSD
jgi:ferritin-like protein